MLRRIPRIAAGLVLVALAAGCGGGDDAPEATGDEVRVASLDNSFRPETVEVAPGTEVVWTNQGRHDHDVVPVDDDADWGVGLEDFGPGEEYRHVFTEPGEHRYYCTIHATHDRGMIGTVIVTE